MLLRNRKTNIRHQLSKLSGIEWTIRTPATFGEKTMNNDDYDKLCKSLEQAIAHASGEEVEGLVLHTPKVESKIVKHKTAPISKRFATRIATDSEQHIS
jgi:hypothetical protein